MRSIIVCFITILLFIACSAQSSVEEYDLLITNAKIIDGTGTQAYEADILVHHGLIERIGDIGSETEVTEIVDAEGRVVSPGFIDMHSHGNPLNTPMFQNFLSMGVTTLSLGQDGRSVSTTDVAEWMDEIAEKGLGPNIIHLQGHGTLRNLADAPLENNLDEEFLREMQHLMSEAMKAGSFGMTTGLEYQPGSFADLDELIAVAEPVAEYQGLVKSHIRNEDADKVEESVRELLDQGLGSGAPVHVSHIKIVFGDDPSQAEAILNLMDEARAEGLRVTADVYPYTASYTGIGIVFPEWAKPPHDYDEVVESRREELEQYLRDRVTARNGPEATLFGTNPWAGKTLDEVADSLNKPFEDVLIEDIGPRGAGAAYFVMDESVMTRFLQDPNVMVSSDGSPTMQHPRSYGSFAKIIETYVNREQLFSLEEAVRKMTGLPAATLGLDDPEKVDVPRGQIREGFAADLLIFDPSNVKANATFDAPHQLAEGFDWVFVNGKGTVREGKLKRNLHGEVIKKRH